MHEFGKYSAEEFEMKKYDRDPSAEAVVIYDIGQTYFVPLESGFEMVFERKTKLKIFGKAGLKWAQFEIEYFNENQKMESVEGIKANTYNFENGIVRTTALNTKNIYEEKRSEHWMAKKFAMPDVKEGSVIEVRYKIRSPYFFNFRSWYFQKEIPVIYSEYKTKMVPFYEYSYILQGANKFDSFKTYVDNGLSNQFGSITYQDMVYEFIMNDLSAFKDEEFITSSNDYIIKLDFQLATVHQTNGTSQQYMTTWPKMIEDMLDEDSFGRYYKSSKKFGKSINDTMKISTRTVKERSEIVERYVKSNFNWNGSESKMASKTLKEFLKDKTGNSADINLYLAGLLNAVGVEAFPVLLSTRDHGKIKYDYPFHHFFNYVVVVAKIEDKYVFMDATEPLAHFGELPTICLNDKGLVVNKEKPEWANFGSTTTSLIENNFTLKLSTNADSIIGAFRIISNGYDALTLRSKYLKDPNSLKKELTTHSFTVTDSITTNNLYQIEKSFEVSFNAQVAVERVENKILISPFCETAISENPLKQVFRTYPIDMIYKKARHFTSSINIPDGYKSINNPAGLSVHNNQIDILYKVEEIDKTIKVDAYYNFKKDVYDPSEYTYIKGYFNKIVDKFNEKIILSQK